MEQLELPFKFKKDKEEPDWAWIRESSLMMQSSHEQQLQSELAGGSYYRQLQAQQAAYESQMSAYQPSLDGWSASPRRSWYQRIFGG